MVWQNLRVDQGKPQTLLPCQMFVLAQAGLAEAMACAREVINEVCGLVDFNFDHVILMSLILPMHRHLWRDSVAA